MTLEELLNKLIEKGYYPRGVKDVNIIVYNWIIKVEYRGTYQMYHIRELVSKESLLWQFVCKNRLVEYIDCAYCKYIQNDEEIWYETQSNDYRYRLIESALCGEDKLEQFLLDNIKVWNEN